jgi:hypothetical protein
MQETTTTEQKTCGGIMGEPEIRNDEKVLMRTQGVHVKSIPFEGILTNRRIILVDRAKNLLPPKEIPLATIKDVETGENAIRDLTLTISIMAKTGETRQMILTFSRQEGGNRVNERDEWVRLIREGISTSFEQVIRNVIPGVNPAQRPQAPASPYTENPPQIQPRMTIESARPVTKILPDTPPEVPAPVRSPAFTVPAPAAAAPAEVVFCTRCGSKVPADSAFCNKCGTPVVVPGAIQSQSTSRQVASPVSQPVQTPRVPADTSLRQSLAWDDEPDQVPAPASRQAPAARTPEKKGFLGGLFSPKKRVPPAPKAAAPAPAAPKKSRGSLMPGKKTIITGIVVLVVIIAVVIGAVFVYPMLTSGTSDSTPGTTGASTTPSSTGSSSSSVMTNTGVASVTVKETAAATVPVTGVWVRINYIGSYEGKYGMSSDLQQIPGDSVPNSGDHTYEVVNATGVVQAVIQKEDSSTKHDLVVEIYKDGKLLTTGKTGDSYGRVTISADTGTSVSGTQAATTTANTGNATVTAKATTAVTTAKTTVAAVKTTTKSS